MKTWFRWAAFLLILFAIAMQAAHIGSIWLWAAVYVVAIALMIVGQPKPQDAGRRLRSWRAARDVGDVIGRLGW
jgi:peptidoglycan/LPS O-acetylase OafA/YrhL